MGYIQDFERDFRAFIEEKLPVLPDGTEAALVTFVKQKVFESYKNGMAATTRGIIKAAKKATAAK